MNVFNKRVSRLESQLARCAEGEQQDRSIVEAIMENRRRRLGLPTEDKQQPVTSLRKVRSPPHRVTQMDAYLSSSQDPENPVNPRGERP